MRRAIAVAVAVLSVLAASAAGARVLRVGTYKGRKGQFRTLQSAIDDAKPGDWILVGPGDYKTTSTRAPSDAGDSPAAALITTPRLRIRGMNRNTVVLDGTKPGSPQCSSAKADQNFGPDDGNGGNFGVNGVMVWKASDVWVENLTACNFLSGSGNGGNGIWWNGGDESGQVGGSQMYGSYLTATSTFYDPGDTSTAAAYGIFSSNWSGGTWNQTYTSNFDDSGLYIGACQQVCDQTVDHAWSEYNALGYSGSNSGGRLTIQNSEFDNNEDGFDTNSQNGDNPPPQDGSCPDGGTSPITHTHSCWVFMNNYVHDNNNPNVPSAGLAAAGPVGTGMSISGGRNDTVMNNRFSNNGAWGVIFVPFPDSGGPCTGGTQTQANCVFDESGDALLNNTFSGNGFFNNPTNGDFALTNVEPGPTDCFSGNVETSGAPATSTPSNAEQMYPTCDGHTAAPSAVNPQSAQFTEEVACDSQLYLALVGNPPCAPTDSYPRFQQAIMHPLPSDLQSMPNPCQGLPKNPWCGKHKHHKHKHHKHHKHHKRKHRGSRDPDHDGDNDHGGRR